MPLPRGSVGAAYPGTCPACLKDYAKGETPQPVSGREKAECRACLRSTG
ncbi:putative protein OS=Streptomyces fumanus OX=67302 GN=GCM10018772_61840 PE=4 SV=1 [Streptomyces fumanus]|uniref:Uncharacterized protein n=1 Tax=Streptomyces fumanus TaxID=67302 RepID=A0A919AV86_9ACTN|nr:hypothetical protein [Streptomyces fumanus]GHF27844.1 hypothetical protein GCM10018772_61840 [Streptomyces fumanus]